MAQGSSQEVGLHEVLVTALAVIAGVITATICIQYLDFEDSPYLATLAGVALLWGAGSALVISRVRRSSLAGVVAFLLTLLGFFAALFLTPFVDLLFCGFFGNCPTD